MKAAALKPAAPATRHDAAGLRPVTPDRQPRPRSAQAGPELRGAQTSTPTTDLDRSRRLSLSDPQGRYGNSEVARVAMQQNPAPVGARRVAARPLPEKGTAATAKRKGG